MSYNEAKLKALKAQSASDLSSVENLYKSKTKNTKNSQVTKHFSSKEYSSAPAFSGMINHF